MSEQQRNIDWQIFESLGETLPESLAVVLQRAADRAIEDARARMNFKQNTPGTGVRDAIRAEVEESTLQLGVVMPAHGWFQEYGVTSFRGAGTFTGEPIDDVVAEAFNASKDSTFAFGTGNYSNGGRPWGAYYTGIEAKNFLQIEGFIDSVTEYINNNLEEEWL